MREATNPSTMRCIADADSDSTREVVESGSGKSCVYCDKPILVEDVEYEVPIPSPPTTLDADESVLRFHVRCHNEWLDTTTVLK